MIAPCGPTLLGEPTGVWPWHLRFWDSNRRGFVVRLVCGICEQFNLGFAELFVEGAGLVEVELDELVADLHAGGLGDHAQGGFVVDQLVGEFLYTDAHVRVDVGWHGDFHALAGLFRFSPSECCGLVDVVAAFFQYSFADVVGFLLG